jgi:hypothetical protein
LLRLCRFNTLSHPARSIPFNLDVGLGYRLCRPHRQGKAPWSRAASIKTTCNQRNTLEIFHLHAHVMALILEKSEENKPTANYPEPQQYVKYKSSFVFGNFLDVDILASEHHCETCSVYLLCYRKTLKTDCIIGALPLVWTYGEK